MLGGTGLDIRLQSDGKSQDTDEHKKLRDPGAQYHQTFFKGEGYGLNNEYHEFNIQTGKHLLSNECWEILTGHTQCP